MRKLSGGPDRTIYVLFVPDAWFFESRVLKYLDVKSSETKEYSPSGQLPVRSALPALSIRAKLLGLVFSLLLILICSGYLLQNILNGSLQTIGTQTAAIQTLQHTTKAAKNYTNLRWTYLTYLGSPTNENLKGVQEKLEDFRVTLTPIESSPLKNNIEDIETLVAGLEANASDLKSLQPDSEEAAAIESEATKKLGQIDEALNGMVNTLEEMLSHTSVATREHTGALHTIPVIFMAGGFMAILFATLVAIVQLFMPIGRITRAMTAASIDTANAKDYILPVPRQDEIGKATRALNSLLVEVSEGIDRISNAERKLRDTGQYLQAVMDNVVDGVITLNDAGRIETFSPSAEKLFQRAAREAVGAHISTLLFDHKGGPYDLIDRITRKNPVPPELLARTQGGVMIPVEVAVGQTGFAGRTMFVATLRDISARKQMESFIEQAQRMETVGRMTGGIAHDFNNMLTVISGNFELIERRVPDGDPFLKSMIAMGLDTVRKGKEMTQRLLAISSKQLLKPEVMDLTERLPAVVEMIQRAVREDIEINIDIPVNAWNIRVDPVQFESALLNLAINARDAIPAQGGRILIEVSNITLNEETASGLAGIKPGPYVQVMLSDNGRGIPAGILDRVLEPFFTTKNSSKGTGLGLSMVYGFTRQSGGCVAIDSIEGKGTSVRLFFPRSEEKTSASSKAVGDSRDQDIPTGDESLMVVEDRPDVLKYVTQTLRELGYRVTAAGDAQAALQKLQRRKSLDLLVTDVVMPGEMNGEMLAQEALRQMPGLKVLYISGYTQDALIEQGALKQGVNLLPKPFTRADLARHVRRALDAA